jgi:putative intracellular protease/amidase
MTAKPTALIPLPKFDFDPTEVAITWKVLRENGLEVHFATADGEEAQADALMLTGEGLDLWGALPLLKKFKYLGLFLRGDAITRKTYQLMVLDPKFQRPLTFANIDATRFDALVLPGGHRARGMRPYLEDEQLQAAVAAFFDADKPVGAICHGVVLAARSVSPATGQSVLYGRKTTALPWEMERKAWRLMQWAGRFWDAGYYRTYRESASDAPGFWSVQAEVTRALACDEDFLEVPEDAEHRFLKTSGMFRDSPYDARAAWVVSDGNYVSARWPGDVYAFANKLAALTRAARGL